MKKCKGYTPHIEFGLFVWYNAKKVPSRVPTNAKAYDEAAIQLQRRLKDPPKEMEGISPSQIAIPDAEQPKRGSSALEPGDQLSATKKGANKCAYCYGFGMDGNWWKIGTRWVITAVNKKKGISKFIVPCDRCGKP